MSTVPPSGDVPLSCRPPVPGELLYPKGKAGKGCALIIGNSFKDDKEYTREPACTRDLENMGTLWKDCFGCELHGGQVHRDKTATDMITLLKNLANDKKGWEYVVVVISTHGGLRIRNKKDGKYFECLLGNDGNPIFLRDLQSFFRNDLGVNLQNIPKIFILQYCRGDQIDEGVLKGSTDTPDLGSCMNEPELLPKYSDIVTAFAAHESHQAWKSDEGSWLLCSINDIFQRYAQDYHVVDMLTMVNDQRKNGTLPYQGGTAKAMTIFESSFTKQLFLTLQPQPRSSSQ